MTYDELYAELLSELIPRVVRYKKEASSLIPAIAAANL
jgi:hypothetical protein